MIAIMAVIMVTIMIIIIIMATVVVIIIRKAGNENTKNICKCKIGLSKITSGSSN